MRRMSNGLGASEMIAVAIEYGGAQLRFDGDALVVVEVARVDRGARAFGDVGERGAPAVELLSWVPQNGVHPEQGAQRPVAIAGVAGGVVELGEKQRGQGVGLRRLALFGVAAAGVPPEAAAEGVVPEPATLQEVGLALGGVAVLLSG